VLAYYLTYLAQGLYLAQQDIPTSLTNILLQYGPVGVIAVLASYVAWVLWKRNTAAQEAEIVRLTAEIKRERERADRLEAELTARNTDIQEKYVTSLEQAKSVISEAVLMMRLTK